MKRKIADILKELRTEKGLSFAKLSKEIGISHSSLCRWENGQADIASDYILILCKYYKVDANYLLGLED